MAASAEKGRGDGSSSLGWVRVVIWIALAAIGVTVLVVTFSGGLVPDQRREGSAPPAEPSQSSPVR